MRSGSRSGRCSFWVDRVPGMSQAELWLEVVTEDTAAAARHLETAGIARCDAIEPLGEALRRLLDLEPEPDRPPRRREEGRVVDRGAASGCYFAGMRSTWPG